MMKYRKIICFALCISLLGLCGCKDKNVSSDKKCEVALITDIGTVEDGSYNEDAYRGMLRACEEKGVVGEVFVPSDLGKQNYLNEIKSAVKGGAKLIVCPGYLLGEAVYDAQKQYKDVSFILLDTEPHNKDYSDISIGEKTEVIKFADEESGFLAGYTAVRDGYRFLGFIGGVPEDTVIKTGYGFVQGADYAAIELGVKIYVAYSYTDTFSQDENVKNMAANWYSNGVEVIYTCGDDMNRSVMSAADEAGKSVILSDSGSNDTSASVAFACHHNVEDAVYDAVNSYYSGTFLGGQVKELTVTEDGVGIDMENGHFNDFTQVQYDAIYSVLKDNVIKPYNHTDIATTEELDLVNTQIIYSDYISVNE